MASTQFASTRAVRPKSRVRWGMAGLLGAGVLVNYFDRVNISVAGGDLAKSLHLDAAQLGILFSSFLWTYAILQIPMGAILDRFGVKWVQRVGIALWTLATTLTAVAGGLGLVLVARLLLGVAETPQFPAAQKSTGYWFPRHERGLCTAMFDGAAKFSNVVGIPLMAWAVSVFGWRGAFWLTAILSAVFFVAWWLIYRDPKEAHREGRVSDEELAYIRAGGAQDEDVVPTRHVASLGYLLRQRKVWGLTIGFACYGYAFYMMLTWLPGFLEKEFHMDVLKSGLYAAVPWLVATLTDVVIGGWLVDFLIARGKDPLTVRRWILVLGMIVGLAVAGAAFTRDPIVAVTFISIGLGGLAASAPVGSSIVALIAPEGQVATTGGIVNCVNNLFGIAAPIVTGFLVVGNNFGIAFAIAGVFIFVGIMFYIFVLGRIEAIPAPAPVESKVAAGA